MVISYPQSRPYKIIQGAEPLTHQTRINGLDLCNLPKSADSVKYYQSLYVKVKCLPIDWKSRQLATAAILINLSD